MESHLEGKTPRGWRRLAAPALTAAAALGLALHPAWAPDAVGRALGPGAVAAAAAARDAALWLAMAWLAGRLADLLIKGAARPGRPQIPRLLSDLTRAVIYAVAGLGILAFVLDQPVTGLLATSGVLIAVLGFALRNMIADVVSGIALNIERPYRIGDWIEVAPGATGRVDEIDWRATRLITLDGTAIVVPNGVVAGTRFTNLSHGRERLGRPAMRAMVAVTLAPEVPVERVRRILGAAMACADDALDEPRADVVIDALTPAGVVYLARFWVGGYDRLAAGRDQVATAILEQLGLAGLEPVAPRLELRQRRRPLPGVAPEGTRRALLRQVELFAPFDDEDIAHLAATLKRRRLSPGQAAVRQGEAGASLFLVAEGVLDVHIAVDGRVVPLDRMRPGQVFGEMSLLTGQPRSASVVAHTDAVIYELDKADLDPPLRRRPDLAARLAALMIERQRRNDARARAGLAMDAMAAVSTPQDLLARLRAFFNL